MEERFSQLEGLIAGMDDAPRAVLTPLMTDVACLERDLDELRRLPQILVDPKNPKRQKTTPAAKLCKEKLQQYNNCIKIVLGALGHGDVEEDSPVRAWFRGRMSE